MRLVTAGAATTSSISSQTGDAIGTIPLEVDGRAGPTHERPAWKGHHEASHRGRPSRPRRTARATPPTPAALAEVGRIFADWQVAANVSGLVYGVVSDGRLVAVHGFGVQDTVTNKAVTADSLFRIASMSKAFTALAVLDLRDGDKLAIDDPAETYVLKLKGWTYPTSDSPRITVRDLLTHSAGLIEDNPCGDRRQSLPEADFTALLRAGVPFSRARDHGCSIQTSATRPWAGSSPTSAASATRTIRAVQGILCQGRGSAANSAVCYVLGVTAIDPVRSGLLFERFISAEQHEPPDIDVDFESDRREEVIQWVFERYGRDRAALCATVVCFGPRGAIRDVGKVLGLTEDVTGALASQVWGWSKEGVESEHAASLNLNLDDRRLRLAIDLARELIGLGFSRLGVRTAVFNEGDSVGGLKDPEVARAAASVFSRELDLRLGTEIEASKFEGGIRIRWRGKSGEGEEVFDRVLAAVGRHPALDRLDLDATGLHLRSDGVPEHDRATLRCGTSPIFIAGNADHDRPVLHEASREGAVAGAGAACLAAARGESPPAALSITFSDPDMASIGTPLSALGHDAIFGQCDFEAGRSLIEDRPGGMIRLYARREDGLLAGGEMIGPAVEHLAHLVAVLVQEKVTAERALALPFYHPCYEENLKDCLRDLLGHLGKGTGDRG